MPKTRKKRRSREPAEVHTGAPTKEERFSTERFLYGIGDPLLKEVVVASLRSGYQLESQRVPYPAVPAVLILACFAREYADVELVDDYEDLIKAMREAISEPGQCAHTDLYLASCICILHDRQQAPSYESFVDVRVDKMFSELVNVEE